mmetsp:Transcript_7018/g.10595  ORF Transcript_7018/g.10595 Transcript_7018/m.10595 type:complete len:107 (-) Transcript_7018:1263-1583(-)
MHVIADIDSSLDTRCIQVRSFQTQQIFDKGDILVMPQRVGSGATGGEHIPPFMYNKRVPHSVYRWYRQRMPKCRQAKKYIGTNSAASLHHQQCQRRGYKSHLRRVA